MCVGAECKSYATPGRLLLPYPHAGTVISNPFQPPSSLASCLCNKRPTHTKLLI
jgi:hypothetical protein